MRDKRQVVESHLDRWLPSLDTPSQQLHEAIRHSVFANGKRLRPILCLTVGEALDGPFPRLIRLACAVEMLHTYSLIHDDLPCFDDDDLRRGIPTCHKVFGEAMAILAGNALMNRAFQLLAEMGNETAPESGAEILSVVQALTSAISSEGGMLGGQAVDIQSAGKTLASQELESMHRAKTGALIQASITCAGILSGNAQDVEKLSEFGLKLGLAFQIVDDILDVEGTDQQLGKTGGKDQRSQKPTYPSLYGTEASKTLAEHLISSALQDIRFLGARGENLANIANFICSRTS